MYSIPSFSTLTTSICTEGAFWLSRATQRSVIQFIRCSVQYLSAVSPEGEGEDCQWLLYESSFARGCRHVWLGPLSIVFSGILIVTAVLQLW